MSHRSSLWYKLAALLVALALLVPVLAACGGGDDEGDDTGDGGTTEETQTPPSTAAFSIDSKVSELAANPDAWAVLVKYIGEDKANTTLQAAPDFTLRQLQPMASEDVTAETLAQINEELSTIEEGGTTVSPTPTPTETETPTTTPSAGALTIDSTIEEILADPAGEAILRECLGNERVDDPQFSMAFPFTLPFIAPKSNGLVTDEMVACVDGKLQALASGGTPTASPEPTPEATPSASPTASPEPTATTPADTRHKGDLTVDGSMFAELLANPDVNALCRQCMGDLLDNPAIAAVAPSYTLTQLAGMSASLTPEMYQCIVDGLAAMPE